jgi:hypothetical protein
VYWKRPVSVTSDVKRFGDLRGQLDVEPAKRSLDIARRRVAHDEVESPKGCRDGDQVVGAAPVEQRRVRRHPVLVRAVERDQHSLTGVLRRLRLRPSRGEAYSLGSGASP